MSRGVAAQPAKGPLDIIDGHISSFVLPGARPEGAQRRATCPGWIVLRGVFHVKHIPSCYDARAPPYIP